MRRTAVQGVLLVCIGAALCAALGAGIAVAATSSRSVPSSFGGNGHNASFDGRLFIVRTGPGWQAYVLRPEAIAYESDGLPQAGGAMWSAPMQVVAGEPNGENALAICEPDATRAPYKCDASNNPSASGAFSCYDVYVFDSDATKSVAQGGQVFRRRHLLLRVAEPNTATAHPVEYQWGALEPLSIAGGGVLHGIEPTFTRDGRLMVWNGSLNNGDQNSLMMYSVAPSTCSATGWSAPKSLSHMINDPAVNTKYKLAQRQLRAADGTAFVDGSAVYGAYPWLLPDGEAVMFSSALMPCRATDDPFGCGPRRNATAVLGYPTNWGIAHIDGGINPSTTDNVRLFFSSPGAQTFTQLPVSQGHDVWPFFGSNTSNYVEISFDDGLDGKYAGFWHMNESVTPAGDLDPTKSPDVSGYFNTARVHGAVAFPAANNGVIGKALVATNGWLDVANDASLSPVNGITLEMTINPTQDPDCDGQNNFRWLLRKGEAYSLVLEETRGVRARVRVAGGAIRELYSGTQVPLNAWTKVTAEYDAPSGKMQIRFDDNVVAEQTFAPAQLSGTTDVLTIGGIGTSATCPVGGNFAGVVDEVSISRVARHIETPLPPDAGVGDGSGSGSGDGDAGTGGGNETGPGGGCCDAGGSAPTGSALLGFGVLALVVRRRRPRS
ncbi:MAG TPA: LamG-like jellyroll fold domain-containing protein [Kofleriaceae bacterium]|nr:LamG-like jellyroll fold domain-containing protein [Kofleriaceae bacterium]